MSLFVVTEFLRRRRRPRRARDEMPVRPLLDVLALCALLAMGGLMASISSTALAAYFAGVISFDHRTLAGLVLLGVIAIELLRRAVLLWFRLNRA
jgi:uncharacterized membrane protein YfbV (UPF0208 family)